MAELTVKDIDESKIDEAFRVCSHGKLDNPLQMEGMELRRRWLRKMIRGYGSCVKIAYIGEKPVAQLQFYPEGAVPFIPRPREGVVLLECVYNPFEEARGKGASTSLMKSLIDECRTSPKILDGGKCSFIAAEPFNTGEGTPMERFYTVNGFERNGDEMIYKINGAYTPPAKPTWSPNNQDEETATILFNPTCEYSYTSATRVRDAIKSLYPALPVELINRWEKPETSMRLANHWLVVNGTPIKIGLKEGEAFIQEIRQAVEKSR